MGGIFPSKKMEANKIDPANIISDENPENITSMKIHNDDDSVHLRFPDYNSDSNNSILTETETLSDIHRDSEKEKRRESITPSPILSENFNFTIESIDNILQGNEFKALTLCNST